MLCPDDAAATPGLMGQRPRRYVMHLESAPVHARPASPGTWIALGALVLVLGALSLFLMGCDQVFGLNRAPPCPPGELRVGDICEKRHPNHYACDCDCTGFGVGALIAVSNSGQGINVRQTPAGTSLGTAPNAAQGTIIAGPVQAVFATVDETWWQVDFASGFDGWVVQRFLTVVTPVSVLAKEIDVCLSADYNQNLGGLVPEPQVEKLNEDCSVRVTGHLATITGQQLPPQTQCTCKRLTDPQTWDSTCDAPCLTGVCPVGDEARPQPALAPLSAGVFATTALDVSSTTPLGVFATTTLCQVEGVATIKVGDRAPKTQPHARGFVRIHGRPCPGQSCQVGVSYQLEADDIEFESGTIFAGDVKFVALNLSGASEPGAVNLGPFVGFNLGPLPPGTALTSVEGRRSNASEQTVSVFRNTQAIAVAVNWTNGTCGLSGPLGGTIEGDGSDGELLNVNVDVALNGVILNQPPRANAGANQTVECTSPQGAPVTLDASLSTDPDTNIAFFAWRRGSAVGSHVADPSFTPTLTTQQPLGETTYHLRVVDSLFTADNASVKVKVVDTTASVISCNAPATIIPPKAPIAFKATAADTCGGAAVAIESFECFVVKSGARVKNTAGCKVTTQGDTLTIANSGGTSSVVQWVARATDSAGNVGRKTCEVFIANPGGQQ